MKITKTTLLFIATLFFLALPMMFTSGNAQASVFNYDGAIHNAAGGWDVPADNGSCFGANASDPNNTPAHYLGGTQPGYTAYCRSIAPDWVGALSQTNCESLGYEWHQHGSTPGSCINVWEDDTSAEAVAGRGAHECLYCHDGGHASNRTGYLKGGHKNMSRAADGLPWAGSIANGSSIYTGINWDNPGTTANGTPYWATLDDGTPLFWIYDGWIGTSPRTATLGGSYSCGRCHTTGWTADASMQITKEPVATFGPTIYEDMNLSAADDNGTMQPFSSWDHFGVLCSKCHDAVDGGHANSGSAHMEVGDPYTGDMGASQVAKCLNCHRQVNSLNLPDNEHAPYPGEDLWISAGHGTPGLESHATGYLNSPHARFSGKFSELSDSTKYNSHFVKSDGTCAGCHNVHDSLTDTDPGAEPFYNECGVNCHHSKKGFHNMFSDNDAAPSTISTEGVCEDHSKTTAADCTSAGATWYPSGTEGANFEACVTCHMPGGLHLFRISTDANYTTIPGADQLIPTVPNPKKNDFPEAFVDAGMVCLQCHGAPDRCSDDQYDNKTDCTDNGGTWQNAANTKEFTKKAVASGVSADYHKEPTEFTASVTADCLQCHEDKETFKKTGHYNDARLVEPGTELYGPDGATLECGHDGYFNAKDGQCYTDLTFTTLIDAPSAPIFFHHSWFEPSLGDDGKTMVSQGRPVFPGDEWTCAECHTTGYSDSYSGGQYPGSLGFTVGADSRHVWPDRAISGGGTFDEFGIQCVFCHGKNTSATTHTAKATSTAPETDALCGKCHLQDHHMVNGFLNSPHGGYTGTTYLYADVSNSANYDSGNHFVSNYNGCAGCHNVHATTIEAAGPDSEYAGFNNECGITCHGPGSSPYAKNLTGINHPNGPGTPLYGVTDANAMDACVVCHMPNGAHYFRINADPTYTNPDPLGHDPVSDNPNEFGETDIDLSQACGQCHSAGNAPAVGAPELSVDELAQYAQVMHTPADGSDNSVDSVKLFIWVNDGSEDFRINFQVTGSACPEGGCTYSWDFGDGSSAGSGPTPSHTYADGTLRNVTLTITYPDGTHYNNTQPVTPTAVHKLPTCAIATDPAAVTSGNVGDMISFTDASQAGDPADTPNLGVIVNWGDGTAFTSGNAGDAFTHTYMVNGDYRVVETVKDGLGFSCENDVLVTINKPNVAVTTTGLTLNALYSGTWGTPETISYYVKGLNSFGQMVTKVAGNMAPGTQTTVNLGPDTYDVYLYYPTGHSCTPSTNPTHVDLSSGAATVLIYGCN